MTSSRKPPANGGTPPDPASRPAKTARTESGEKAFDVWLERGLHELFDQFADEPIPDALKAILDADRDAPRDVDQDKTP